MLVNEMFEELVKKLELDSHQQEKLGKFLAEHIGDYIEDDFELKYRYENK